jgi:hypothetical protein
MFLYSDLPFVNNPECLQYNKEKLEEYANQMAMQYMINKRIHFNK